MVPTGFLPELKNPKYPCDTDRPKAVGEYLSTRNFLDRDERVRALAPTAPGRNMTWRVETNARSFVVKQFQPWPANGRAAPGADERFRAECQFYRTARIADGLGRALPTMLHHDCRVGCVIFEDVGAGVSNDPPLSVGDAESLAWFLVSLHHHSQSVPSCARYGNREVVGWLMAHLFQQASESVRGRSQDHGVWLARFARMSEKARHALEDARGALGRDGPSLVHGDFRASNWIRAAGGELRVVDAEFSFFGPPEFDAGTFLASLLHGRAAPNVIRAALAVLASGCMRYHPRLTAAFAAVQLCGMLEHAAANGSVAGPRGAAASAVLRRVARAVECDTLEPLAG